MLTKTERDLGELLGDITHNLERLVKGEFKLLKVGAEEWIDHITAAAILIAVGGMLALLTTGLALTAAVAGLAERMPLWQAALVVALVVAILAAASIAIGLRSARKPRSVEHVQQVTERMIQGGTNHG